MADPRRDRLIELYQAMSEHTAPQCAKGREGCGGIIPHSCCDPMVCELMADLAKTRWGVVFQPTGHPDYPLLGPDGCVAAPHMRPLCTVHVCCINSLGFKRDDPEWTQRYFEIREQINQLEAELWGVVFDMSEEPEP